MNIMATAKKQQPTFVQNLTTTLSHKRIRTLRLGVQILMFFIVNGVILGLSRTAFPAPIVMPAGAPFATVWGGFDAIQYLLTHGQFPFLVFGIFFITGATVGKLFCGWACPVGLWQDMISWIPTKKWKISRPDNKAFQEFSGMLLWTFVLFCGWLGIQRNQATLNDNMFTNIPYEFFEPGGILLVTLFYAFSWGVLPGGSSTSDVFNAMDSMGSMFIWKMAILLIIMLLSMKVPRMYCRWVCPTGALLGYVSPHSILTVKRDPLKCEDNCQKCEDACPMGVPILDEPNDGIANSLCISCGNCIDTCPEAMSFTIRL